MSEVPRHGTTVTGDGGEIQAEFPSGSRRRVELVRRMDMHSLDKIKSGALYSQPSVGHFAGRGEQIMDVDNVQRIH